MSKRIGCVSEASQAYLLILVAADVKRMQDLQDHAHSRGDVGYVPRDLQAAETALEVIRNPKPA